MADENFTEKKEFLSFRLDQEEYGLDILKVQEIRSYTVPTRIARVPEFIKGVVNLRGTIIPIVDLRIKFGCSSAEYSENTVVIILKLQERVVGIVVDSVSDVISMAQSEMKPAPTTEVTLEDGDVLGLANIEDRMLILLNIEQMMSRQSMQLSSTELF